MFLETFSIIKNNILVNNIRRNNVWFTLFITIV